MSPLGFWDQVVCMLTGHEPGIGVYYVLAQKDPFAGTPEAIGEMLDFVVIPCRRCGVLFWGPWVGVKRGGETAP